MKTVLGLRFFDGPASAALSSAAGLCVFPSAPGLATLEQDARYRDALLAAQTRYVDSGFLTLAWFCLSGERLCRVSGLCFLKKFLAEEATRQKKILWVHASEPVAAANQKFLRTLGFSAAQQTHYVAPRYPAHGKIEDAAFSNLLRERQPEVIVLLLGSGIQEPLAASLKSPTAPVPLILCLGGAMDLLTGQQAKVPAWADKLFLGWLFRILFTPRESSQGLRISPLVRYLRAFSLVWLLICWRRRLPGN